MNSLPLRSLAMLSLLCFPLVFLPLSSAQAATEVGAAAPGFTVSDINGEQLSLDKLKGKVVVLEWFNIGCPYVRKHYGADDMQALQKEYLGKEVVWITINSTAQDHGDFKDEEASKKLVEKLGIQSHFVLDPEGTLGNLYEAKTTPHMFVIDAEGTLAYRGAIDADSDVDADPKDTDNYVRAALDSVLAGTAVKESDTKPYGCSVKYQ